MPQDLTVHLDERTYEAISPLARIEGTSAEKVATDSLERSFAAEPSPRDSRSEAEKQAARKRFERHFGTIHCDDPNAADNERIDADLAREYAREYEDD